MKLNTLRLAFLLSTLFHLGLGLFFYFWRFNSSGATIEETAEVAFIELPEIIEPALPEVQKTARVESDELADTEQREASKIEAPVMLPPLTAESGDETIIWPAALDSLLAVADSVARTAQLATYSVPEFFPAPIPLVPYREYPKKRPTMFPMEKLSGNPGAYADRAAEEQYRRGGGSGQQPGNLLALVSEGVKALEKALNKNKTVAPPRIRKVPTREEMAALRSIWSREEATEHDIYKDLDDDIKLTAEDLHRVLQGLVEQGMLEQQIISPRHEFTFMTPLGAQKVEMNRLNVLNRVYRYQSRIDKEHMMRFLQAAH